MREGRQSITSRVILSSQHAVEALPLFPRHHKIQSWLAFHALHIPTLKGIILPEWSEQAEEDARRFAMSFGYTSLLLRTDRAPEVPDAPAAGFLVDLDKLDQLEDLFADSRICFLLEPRSPFNDFYSLNLSLWPNEEAVICEVVGPGFDAGDLKRGRVSPHESYNLRKWSGDVLEHRVVSTEEYRRGWGQRLQRVGKLAVAENRMERQDSEDQRRVRQFLIQVGETRLLDHEMSYAPIPHRLLRAAFLVVADLPGQLRNIDLPGDPLTVSLSYFGDTEEPIYWDVVWPHLKYEVP
jgi:hypothetical protein